jgi:DNA (cytosine-5)-methyltransferase 3A
MNVISLFDGMSCGQIALERAGIHVNNYFASEIKKTAIKVTKDNYPDTICLGDVTQIDCTILPKIDLLIGGSPCQDFTRLKVGDDNKGMYGEKSKLFFEYVRILREVQPKYFLLENVVMSKEYEDIITDILGVSPIHINSNLVSFQNRDRLYWTNIPNISIPKNMDINFQDFKDIDVAYCDKFKVNKTPSRISMYKDKCPNVTYREKINCLTCKQDRWNNSGLVDYEDFCRYLTTRELELAQTVPVGYTSSVSWRQAEDLLGDGWTVDVIAHIFRGMKENID